MANSSVTLNSIMEDAQTFGDLAPALATGGYSTAPAISISNDVIAAMLLGGPDGQPLNWKWNRINVTPFVTISWQQDYFIPGLVNLGWLETCWCSDINNSSSPKPKFDLEVHRDLDVTSGQTGYPGKICWIPNSMCVTGTWGNAPLGPTSGSLQGNQTTTGINPSGQQNPGPNVIYTNPLGSIQQPINATTIITDPNGFLWCLTTFGTCGATEPTWTNPPVYPSYASPNTVASTVTDGSCVWTAINPSGQALRLSPVPPQTGKVWLIQPVAQKRVPLFTDLTQTIEPVPDDYATYFKQGFFTQCFRRSPDPKVRAKFKEEWSMWLRNLDMAVRQGQRELDDFGFFPGSSVMQQDGSGYVVLNPAEPYGPFGY